MWAVIAFARPMIHCLLECEKTLMLPAGVASLTKYDVLMVAAQAAQDRVRAAPDNFIPKVVPNKYAARLIIKSRICGRRFGFSLSIITEMMSLISNVLPHGKVNFEMVAFSPKFSCVSRLSPFVIFL